MKCDCIVSQADERICAAGRPINVPELNDRSGSWIATSPAGTVRELWTRSNAERAAAAGWTVETAAAYLGRINAAIMEANRS